MISFYQVAKYYAQARCFHIGGIKERNIDTAVQAFENARELYARFRTVQHEQSQELSLCGIHEIGDVCENLASLYLQKHRMEPCFDYCQKVIQNGQILVQFMPHSHVGYYYLAEGFRMIPERHMDALECYKTCYQLLGRDESRNIEMRRECFLYILALGIMHDSLEEIPDIHECDKDTMCTALFGHLVNWKNIRVCTEYIHYLMLETEGMPGSGLASRLPFDASFIKILKLWEATYLTPALVDALFKKGMTVTLAEIGDVVDRLGNGQMEADLLVSLCNNCRTAVDYKYFYSEALRQHKPTLAVALIHCGHKVDPKGVLSKIKYCELRSDYAASLGRSCNSPQRSKLLTDMLNNGNKELIHVVMTSGSLSPDEVQINRIAPIILANLGTELLNELFKKLPPSLHLGKDYFKRICDTRCSGEVKADFLSLLLEHNASNLVDEEDVVRIVDLKRVNNDQVAKIAQLCPKVLRTKVLKRLLDAGNNKAVTIAFLDSGPIKPEKVNPKTIAPHCFSNPNWEMLELLVKKVPPCGPRKVLVKYYEAIQSSGPSDEVKAQLFCLLLKNKAGVKILNPSDSTQVIHVATELALNTGNMELLETACSLVDYPLRCDDLGQTPFHLAMKRKESSYCVQVCEILNKYPKIANPLKKDRFSKVAADYASSSRDKRLKILLQTEKSMDACAANEHATTLPQLEKKHEQINKPEVSLSEHRGATSQDKSSTSCQHKKVDKSKPMPRSPEAKDGPTKGEKDEKTSLTVTKDDSRQEANQWKSLLDRVVHKGTDYFKTPHPLSPTNLSRQESEQGKEQVQDPAFEEEIEDEDDQGSFSGIDSEDKREVTWEVECTEKVVKFLKNKRHPSRIISAATEKIRRLGHERSRSLCKPVAKENKLFEAKLTKSARILWGYDIQFSDSCTRRANKDRIGTPVHIYSEVIRVWDIVLDHDKIHHAVQNVLKSMERGKNANVNLRIIGNKQARDKRSSEPREFVLQPDDQESVATDYDKFVPAASIREDEYNVLHFYSVSMEFVNSILNGQDARRDFPFKEWPKEHDIINMPQGRESILLLGRSGTGKTTCCLYRLWNEFCMYWVEAINKGPLCLRRPLSIEESDLQVTENDDEFQEDTSKETLEEAALPDTDSTSEGSEQDLQHLHQVFVTKNYVLCAQVRKKFYDMCASHHELLADHLPFEEKYKSLPIDLSQIEDHGYPLFVTSREFLILLDSSINDLNIENSKAFFPRDKDGNLAVTILSSDYDHEELDTLLELDEDNESDDEEEDSHEEAKTTETKMHSSTKWQEVTSQYFSDKIWSKISHKCEMKRDIDPLLVWMEIKSFIKGSAQAVQSSTGFLTLDEYETLGKKMAVNFSGNREMIYSLFEEYQSYVQRNRSQNLFDECDLLHHIYQRLKKRRSDLPWSIHHFYVDEVQDFTQAELLLVLHCCRDPNGLFLTGDTAQSIMRGVSFRFKDVVSLFHEAKEKARRCYSRKITVPKIHELEINFRSHSGILKLAASVIHLLKEMFPFSFDNLPVDNGLYPGPKPVLLVSCKINDLAFLLRKNKRESSFIEFGARQVIIVQTEDAKKKMPDDLKSGIVLTVFEAKGLEFDDVLLYNFFHDSNIGKEWRVVASNKYIQDTDCAANVQADKYMCKPHAIDFNEQEHKSLNPELKYLYTAITRAKCNLWIYDENSSKHDPMFYYWIISGLVKPVSAEDGSIDDSFQAGLSSPEDWKRQGDLYKEKRLWEAAITCYSKFDVHRHLEEEARAYMFAQQARKIENDTRKKQQLYMRAAECFLLSDEIEHEISLLEKAAQCLRNAKQYNEAIQLFKKLEMAEETITCLQRSGRLTEAGKECETVGKVGKAKRMYKKARDYSNLCRLLENEGSFSEVIKVFDEAGKRFEALEKAKRFEQAEFVLEENFRSKELASKYARSIMSQKRRRNDEELIKVVRYLPLELRLKYLKQVGLFEEAVAEHINAGQHKQAERVMSAQGMYDLAIKQAKARSDKSVEARFTLEKILSLINDDKKIPVEFINCVSQCGIKELTAEAHLLHARDTRDKSKAMSALRGYQESMNPIGKLESYLQLLHCGHALRTHADTVNIIRACSTVKLVTDSLLSARKRTASDDKNIKQALDFYHIRKEGKALVVSEHHSVWLVKDETKSLQRDDDGMIIFDQAAVVTKIAKHLDMSLKELLKKSADIELQERLKKYHFHVFIRDRHYLMESLPNYPPQELILYLWIIEQILNIGALCSAEEDSSGFLIALLSPLVTWFLPLSKLHYRKIAQSKNMCNTLHTEVQRVISTVLERQKTHSVVMVDDLLNAWRFSTITGTTGKFSILISDTAAIPYYYLAKNKEGKVFHVFKYWLKACEILRKEQAVTASAGMMFAFLAKIAGRSSLNISVMNFVDIATVCTIGLTAIVSITAKSHLLMPKMYERIAQVFDDFNTMQGGWWLLDSCVAEVATHQKYNTTRNLEMTCISLLFKILQLMLGVYNQRYNVLQYALYRRDDGSALYCLELTVVLIANLYILTSHRNDELHNYLSRVYRDLSKIQHILPQGNCFAEAYVRIGKADSVGKLFELSQYLMRFHKHSTSLCIVSEKFKSGQKRIMFIDTPIPLHFYKKLTLQCPASATPATPSISTASTGSNQEFMPATVAPESATTASSDQQAEAALMQPSVSTESQEHTPTATNPIYDTQHSTEDDVMVDHDLELEHESAGVISENSKGENQKLVEEPNTAFSDIDRSLIDEQFCGICGEHLREEEAALIPALDEEEALSSPQSPKDEPIFIPLASQELQTLKEHCLSASHEEKRCAHKCYSEIETNQYIPLKNKIDELLSYLSSKKQLNSEQESLCEKCRTLLRESDRELEDVKSKYDWRKAASLLQPLIEKMESLCGQLDQAVAECRQREEEMKEKTEDSKDEKAQDEDDDDKEEVEEAIEIAERIELKKSKGKKRKK